MWARATYSPGTRHNSLTFHLKRQRISIHHGQTDLGNIDFLVLQYLLLLLLLLVLQLLLLALTRPSLNS